MSAMCIAIDRTGQWAFTGHATGIVVWDLHAGQARTFRHTHDQVIACAMMPSITPATADSPAHRFEKLLTISPGPYDDVVQEWVLDNVGGLTAEAIMSLEVRDNEEYDVRGRVRAMSVSRGARRVAVARGRNVLVRTCSVSESSNTG